MPIEIPAAELATAHCEICGKGAQSLTAPEQAAMLKVLDGWRLEALPDTPAAFIKDFQFANFSDALNFVNELGVVAEQESHHPLLTLTWGRATVSWWTHSIGSVHRNDAVMAAKTDAVYQQRFA
ncbi:4a-hydroxytetrahydrobiopterin dehydratase [Teredinibacter turnerae]|uniref:4a-hydroxytetrahydrobiopterin dehydratase n=1 Tax=Teredinibacter turnerae TaxID=2426 RepID=UPI00037BF15D|nr:4a-hydroxytetrahydrobiopterin dehydratase [Teredinibacter turnerae]